MIYVPKLQSPNLDKRNYNVQQKAPFFLLKQEKGFHNSYYHNLFHVTSKLNISRNHLSNKIILQKMSIIYVIHTYFVL